MLVLSVAVWAGLVVAGLRRIRGAHTDRVRVLTSLLGRTVVIVRSTGTIVRTGRADVGGEVVGIGRDRVLVDCDGREVDVPIASIREIWSGSERIGRW